MELSLLPHGDAPCALIGFRDGRLRGSGARAALCLTLRTARWLPRTASECEPPRAVAVNSDGSACSMTLPRNRSCTASALQLETPLPAFPDACGRTSRVGAWVCRVCKHDAQHRVQATARLQHRACAWGVEPGLAERRNYRGENRVPMRNANGNGSTPPPQTSTGTVVLVGTRYIVHALFLLYS